MKKEITQGEMLDRIFNRLESLQLKEKMHQLFLKNKLKRYDITDLHDKNIRDYNLWLRYHKRSKRLMSFCTYTVLGR